jgi:hypothetical protein
VALIVVGLLVWSGTFRWPGRLPPESSVAAHGVVASGVVAAGVVATVALAFRKPWAIDSAYCTPARRPLHVTGLAVVPAEQRAYRGTPPRYLEQAWSGAA